MIVVDLAKRRASVRSFSREPVGLESVLYAIEAAKEAPSGKIRSLGGTSSFLTLRIKRRIREVCEEAERVFHESAPDGLKRFLGDRGISWRKQFLEEAPYLILVFGRRTELYWVQSVWLSIGYLLLALEEVGLAPLTYTPPRVDWANELLGVPRDYVLQAIIPVGRPKGKKVKESRLSLGDIAFCNGWGTGLSACR